MRVIGLDVHRTFAEVVFFRTVSCKAAARWTSRPSASPGLAAACHLPMRWSWRRRQHGSDCSITACLRVESGDREPDPGTRDRARAGEDGQIDAGILAQLHASGFLPTVWMPDADTEALRRQVSRRTQLVRKRPGITLLSAVLWHA